MAQQTYTKKFPNGKTYERLAVTPRDHVQLQFDGWTPKADDNAKPAASSGGESAKADKTSK